MRTRAEFRNRIEVEGLREALLNSVGLTLLLLSALPYAALLALSLTAMPWLATWAGRAVWLLLLGVIAYLATVIACLVARPSWPSDIGLRRLLDIRRSMWERLQELRSEGDRAGRSVLLPEVAASVRRMDRQVVPIFGQIVVKRDKLNQHLARYDRGELPLPDPAILSKLRQRNAGRQAELDVCLQQAANAYATLLALLNEGDGVGLRGQVQMWARDLEDIYDALVEVRGGLDYYDRALLGPGQDAGERAAILIRLDLEAGLAESAVTDAATDTEAKARPRATERARPKVYPDDLTEREVEVLRLVAKGLTSKECAAELIVSLGTVSRHIANIYNKIGARGRADATRYAYERGLMQPSTQGRTTPGDLTPKEVEVLRLIIEGKTNRQIAAQMRLGTADVQGVVASVTSKISARRPQRPT